MSLSRNDMGRAFEYSIAMSLARYLPATIEESMQMQKARQCFEVCPSNEQQNMVKAASEAIASESHCSVALQSDQMGTLGDVRDVTIISQNGNNFIYQQKYPDAPKIEGEDTLVFQRL